MFLHLYDIYNLSRQCVIFNIILYLDKYFFLNITIMVDDLKISKEHFLCTIPLTIMQSPLDFTF